MWGGGGGGALLFFCVGGGGGGGRIWQHACGCQANFNFTGFLTGSDPVKNALFTGFEIFYPAA